MSSLLEYFNNDFISLMAIHNDLKAAVGSVPKEIIEVKGRIRQENNSSTRIFTFYIPESSGTYSVIISILNNLEEYKKKADQMQTISTFCDDIAIGIHKAPYSNRIYFYSEIQLNEAEVKALEQLCKEKELYLTLRSTNYLKKRMEINKPLAFICHDSSDKELIAKNIAEGLNSRLCFVWYDEYSLRVGQSLRESIEKGIKEAKKCILVLTPNFLENPGWTKIEFNSIFTREILFNQKIVLPVWYKVKKEEVYNYSPSLADTYALVWPDPNNFNEADYEKEVSKLISKLHTEITQ